MFSTMIGPGYQCMSECANVTDAGLVHVSWQTEQRRAVRTHCSKYAEARKTHELLWHL